MAQELQSSLDSTALKSRHMAPEVDPPTDLRLGATRLQDYSSSAPSHQLSIERERLSSL